MAYSGGIKFVKIPFGGVNWIKHDHLKFKERDGAITANLGEIPDCTTRRCENCTARLCEKRHVLVDAGGERGWVQYDFEGYEGPNTIQCVVIGSERTMYDDLDQYYILLVRPTSAEGQYKRVGVGQVQSSCVSRQRRGILLV
jgi:hypothetical protein